MVAFDFCLMVSFVSPCLYSCLTTLDRIASKPNSDIPRTKSNATPKVATPRSYAGPQGAQSCGDRSCTGEPGSPQGRQEH